MCKLNIISHSFSLKYVSKNYLSIIPLLLFGLISILIIPQNAMATDLFQRQKVTNNIELKGFAFKILKKVQEKVVQNIKTLELENQSTYSSETVDFTAFMAPCPGGSGVIGGQVFGDFNYNGTDDQVGYLPDIIVNIYDCDGNGDNQLAGTTTTDENGDYFFSGLSDGTQYRLEFVVPDHLPAYQEAFLGDNGGVIQFVTSPSCTANAAFTHPQDYCEENPLMVATCFINGDPLDNNSEGKDEDVLVSFNWEDSGTSPLPDHLGTAGELGSCYGLGYRRSTQKVYTSAFIKRHVGLGPLGIGGIYEIDMTNPGSPVIVELIDVESIGVDVGDIGSNSDRGLPILLEDPSNDPDAYAKVGRQGIGGLDVSEDGKVWFVNLHDKKLYSVEIDADSNPGTSPTAGDVDSFDIPDPGCTGGEFRPFAVKIFRDEIYVGGTCDAFTSQNQSDLSTVIYKKTGSSFTEILNVAIDYEKGWASSADTCENYSGWFPWSDVVPPICATGFYIYPQPIFSELEFDIDGSIIAGYMDRQGHQLGFKNWPITGNSPLLTNVSGGDLLRIDNNNGTYEIENNGSAGGVTTGGAGNSQGPGGGEFYFEEIFAGPSDNILPAPHAETSQGGLAFYPGAGDVATTALDPYSTLFNSGGVNYMSNSTGTVQNPGYVLYRSSTSSISTFAKANGLGGLIVLCSDDPPLQIGDYVWQDLDSDGIQDACEPALIGVNVSLYDENGAVLSTVQTNTQGQYSFSDLNPNTTYYIVAGTNGQFDPNTAQLNGSLFVTMNDVGDGNDPDKTDSDATIAGSIAGGAFTGMPYIHVQTGDAGYVSNSDDFGFSGVNVNPVAGIGGFVWDDDNQDGIQDGGESGIEGVTIKLFNDADVEIGSTASDASGNYFFSNVSSGNYYVTFDESTNTAGITNYEGTLQNQGGDDTLDSDPNPNTGQTSTFAFDPANGNENDVDAGYFQNEGTISGFVWEDTDQDGIQDGGETGIQGVTVNLIDDSDGTTVSSTTTDLSGNYAFNNIPPGTYVLEYDPSTNNNGIPNYNGSPQNQGGDDSLDSDPNPTNGATDPITFNPGNGDLTNEDAGFFIPSGTISGFVWEDTDEDGMQDGGEIGIQGVTVNLVDNDDGSIVQSTTTNGSGGYAFSNVELGSYVVNFDVSTNTAGITNYNGSPQDQGDDTLDSDANPNTGNTKVINYDPTNGNLSNIDAGYFEPLGTISGLVWEDQNEDGLLDSGEPGIEGATVTLYDANTDSQIQTTSTDFNGNYFFTNVSLGNYYVIFDETTNTAGEANYVGTLQDAGNDALDSDADPTTGQTADFTFDPESSFSDLSAGFYIPTAAIGGFVWNDSDMDGIHHNGELGIEDVTITLFDENDIQITSTTSSSDGSYSFPDVPTGNYYLIFDPTSTGNSDYEFTLQDQGSDDSIDSDADPNNGETIIFSFDPNDGSDNTWSSGFTLPFGSIGDFVFKDCNDNGIQDAGEDGLANVPVSLLSGSIVLQNTSTNSSGFYQFTDVLPGTYIVKFELPNSPTGLDFSPQNQGGDDSLDSDANPFSGETASFTLLAGETKNDIDAGMADNEAPSFVNAPDDEILPCDDPQITDPPTLSAIDNCDDDVDITFNEVINSGTGGGGGCDGGLEIIRTWTVTDDCGNTFVHTQTISTGDELPPVIIGIPDTTVECDDLPNAEDVKAVDDCDLDVDLTYTDSIIMDGDCMKKILRKWIATDDCGNMTMNFQKIYTEDNTAPTITLINPLLDHLSDGGSLTLECDAVDFDENDAVVQDNCDPDVMMTFSKTEEDGDCDTDGYIQKITLEWTAEDNCGNSSSLTITIFVTDTTPPVVTNVPMDLTVDCDEIPDPSSPLFSDDCDDDLDITFEESILGDTCDDYQLLRSWTGTDDCGNFMSIGQTINVQIIPLELMNVPADITVNCTEVPDPANVTVNETCYDVQLDFDELFFDGGCVDKIIRTWTATNACGDEVSAIQTITTEDNAAPQINLTHPALQGVSQGETLIFECDDIINFNENDAEAIDECDSDVSLTFMEMPTVGDCDEDGFLVRLECCWKAEDDCGNFTQFCIFVEIVDSTLPSLSGVPDDLTVDLFNGETVPPAANVTASDNCDVDVDLEMDETTVSNSDNCGFTTTRTWTATDDCGNQVSETQTITATDICDCPDILIDDFTISHADCGETNGAIQIDFALDPDNYNLELSPNLGSPLIDGFTNLPFGNYELTITLPTLPNCEEKIFFDVLQIGCKDTMAITITETIEVCVDDNLIDYAGPITNATIINEGNIQTVMASDIDGNCVMLHPGSGYLGTSPDLICLELCFNNSDVQCDTTYLKVTVEEKPVICELEFGSTEIVQPDCDNQGGSIKLELIGNEGTLQYEWIPNISDSHKADNVPEGVYLVKVTDLLTECVVETTLVLTAPDPVSLEPSDVELIKPVCPGGGSAIISLTNIQYQIINSQNQDLGYTPMTNLPSGMYTLVNANGSCEISMLVDLITVNDWNVEVIVTPETCLGNDGTLLLNVAGANGGYTYHWDGFISDNEEATGLSEGNLYSVTIQDANGCLYTMENLSVEKDCDVIPCFLDISVDAQTPEICGQSNGAVQLQTTGAQGDVEYTWEPMNSMTDAAFGLKAGAYQVIAKDEIGCADTLDFEIESLGKSWTVESEMNKETCLSNDGFIVLQITGYSSSFDFEWTPNVADGTLAENLSAGNYEVVITDYEGCTEALSFELLSDPKLWSASATKTDASCEQTDGTIDIAIAGIANLSYQWSPDVSNLNSASDLAPGNYSITVEDDLGCNELFDIEIEGIQKTWSTTQLQTDVSCLGADGTIEILVSNDPGDLIYQWTPNVSSANTANNLLEGNYEIAINDAKGCSELLQLIVEKAPEPNWTSQITSTGESCEGDDGSLHLQISGGTGNLSYVWTPNVSNTEQATGLNSNTLYHLLITDQTGCTFELTDLAINNDCDPNITSEIFNQTIACGFNTSQLCTSLAELPGSFDALLVCQAPQNGILTIQNDSCLVYESNADFEGLEEMCVVICDTYGFCDTTYFEVLVEGCPVIPCEDMFVEDFRILATHDCDLNGEICVPIPLDEIIGYTLFDNGDLFNGNITGCLNDTSFAYSYSSIPGNGNDGPYQVTAWSVNGLVQSGSFNSVQELLGLLNFWDPTGLWQIDSVTQNFVGGNTEHDYGSLVVEQILSGGIATLELNINLTPNGSIIELPVGMHELIITDPVTGCADSTAIEMICIEKHTIVDSVKINQTKNPCLDLSQLPGDLFSSEIICHDCDNATFSIENECVRFTGQIPGKDIVAAVLCDDLGFCDTTLFKVTILEDDKLPEARFDADTTLRNVPLVIEVTQNDDLNGEFRSLEIIDGPDYAESFVKSPETIVYNPNEKYCGLDAFAYELCNETGCDTAVVNILIKCDQVFPMSGFSPNRDGINDAFRIRGIEQFPDNELAIFNRWGQVIFRKKGYENFINPWEGTYKNVDLPDGTYFYVLDYGDGRKMSGYVEVRR